MSNNTASQSEDVILGLLYLVGAIGALTGLWVWASTPLGLAIGADVPGITVVAILAILMIGIAAFGIRHLRTTGNSDEENHPEPTQQPDQTSPQTPDDSGPSVNSDVSTESESASLNDVDERPFEPNEQPPAPGENDLSEIEEESGIVAMDSSNPEDESHGGDTPNLQRADRSERSAHSQRSTSRFGASHESKPDTKTTDANQPQPQSLGASRESEPDPGVTDVESETSSQGGFGAPRELVPDIVTNWFKTISSDS